MPKGTTEKAKRSAPAAVETVRWTLRMQLLAPLTTTRKARAGKPDSLTADPPRWYGKRTELPPDRRTSASRGLLFYRLLQQATNTDPAPLKDLVIPCDSDQ
jgi:hypothetical protein